MKFRPVPGTITCADYPAPVSGAGVCNMPMVVATATGATAKMVACADPPLRDKAIGIADVHAYGGWIFNGINQHGQFFMAMHSGMAPGRRPGLPEPRRHRHGRASTGCRAWRPRTSKTTRCPGRCSPSTAGRTAPDAAGAGRYRSGVAAEEAWILHGTDALDTQVYNNESFAKCQGLLGGNPGGRAFFRVKRGSRRARRAWPPAPSRRAFDDVVGRGDASLLERQAHPARPDLGVDAQPAQLRRLWRPARPRLRCGGPRSSRRARRRVLDALEVYGVVVDETGAVDEQGTVEERAGRRRETTAGQRPPKEAGADAGPLTPHLAGL